ncbi:anthranilate synthase component I family protein [Effusibacillus lacus]|uniref:anthranilate synthase component I family protein n=1 Tax=Effusibacillus lacus TaxID=1348429 RepID=UPI000BB832B9|nr:anthranilate synthase component I family protein [Effusibacillus lacus]TCS74492.1 aminodeoxychorismate synthase subunit I [Effusibacillus lacus]
MLQPGREAVVKLLEKYQVVPVWMKLHNEDLSPWDAYIRVPAGSHRFLLESGKAGRYSFIGGEPKALLKVKDGISHTGESVLPLDLLRRWLQERRSPRNHELSETDLPPFLCGAVGFLSYDLGRTIERLPEMAVDDLSTPDLYVIEPSWLLVKDHLTHDWYLATSVSSLNQLGEAEGKLAALQGIITGDLPASPGCDLTDTAQTGVTAGQSFQQKEQEFVRSLSKEQFETAVDRIKEYIRAGDVFQVNLSLRESRPCQVPPQQIYEQLRLINPSPYMGILEFPELTLVSCSPELLVRLRGNRAETRPIAGTRKRSGDREQDLQMVKKLIENEKERAEHIMLVDLERNDLGRVCQYGTVKVEELMTIEEYSHVMHIVSHVKGQLRDGVDSIDLLAAAFPGGTITGAPKIRTMEIIEELEPVRRGVYTGSFGWWSFNGDMEVNIAIRTMVIQDGKAHVQAGAGVVIDSIPEREYFESLRKAEALWQAFDLAHRKTEVLA